MPIEILMPALSPTMESGDIATWVKKEGDKIAAGDLLLEVETDKATMEVEATDEGVLHKIIRGDGEKEIKVNDIIGIIREDSDTDEDVEVFLKNNLQNTADSTKKDISAEVKREEEKNNDIEKELDSNVKSDGKRIFITPLARESAKQKGIDIKTVIGSGPYGRIINADIMQADEKEVKSIKPRVYDKLEDKKIPITKMRSIVAKRLTEAKNTIPHFYLKVECSMDNIIQLRSDINNEIAPKKISLNDMVIKACAIACDRSPSVKRMWDDQVIIEKGDIDISVAVKIDDGLITPIVKSADRKSIFEISDEMKDLIERAKQKKLSQDEYQGGVISISNMGMFGIDEFSAIINPPQSSILAIGAAKDVIKEGNVGALIKSKSMTVTMSIDHRVLDGADGAMFLSAFKNAIENPISLMIDR